jgi:hypothetical protein
MEFEADIRIVGKPIYLGVLGIHNQITKEEIHEKVLHPLMSVLGRMPDKMILPSEGTSSALISIWAERNHIDTQCVEADWRKFQRKAGILRDARIQKECSHLVVFLGMKSRSNEQTAIRQAKKGKQVFVVEPNPIELIEYVVEG